MKYFNRFKNKSGFTLIETAIALVILGTILVAISSFFQFGNMMSAKENEQFVIQSQTRLDADKIISDVKYANEVYLLLTKPTDSEKSSSTYSYIYIDNGKIYFSIYQSKTGTRTETVSNGSYLDAESFFGYDVGLLDSLNIQLSARYYDQTYLVDSKIKLVNLSLNSEFTRIQGNTPAKAIKFKVPSEN